MCRSWSGGASPNGAKHYGLPPNDGTITLEKKPWTPMEEILVPGPDAKAPVHHGGERWEWQVVKANL